MTSNVNKYKTFSNKAKLLEKNEEYSLIRKWQKNNDKLALEKIINSYLRLIISHAKKFVKYGFNLDDLIHEGSIGMIHALNKFDFSKDVRLSTYSAWWIRASIQDYVLKNWSIVRSGSTASQKALFFNLNKIKNKILDHSNDYLGEKEVNKIAKELKSKPSEVKLMEARLQKGDQSLDQNLNEDSSQTFVSLLVDTSPNPEENCENSIDNKLKYDWLLKAIDKLSPREKEIINSRKLNSKIYTLHSLGEKMGISKERVRQIENNALKKLKKHIVDISNQNKYFFINKIS